LAFLDISRGEGGNEPLTVRLIPIADLLPKSGDPGDRAPRSEFAESRTPAAVANDRKPADRQAVSASPRESRADVVRGNWAIEGDELVQSKTEYGVELVFANSDWSDFDLTLEAKYQDGPRAPRPEAATRPGCGVVFHRQGSATFCAFGVTNTDAARFSP
jgi:hypothetical protein